MVYPELYSYLYECFLCSMDVEHFGKKRKSYQYKTAHREKILISEKRHCFLILIGELSSHTEVKFEVPLGSVLEPVLFTFYVLPWTVSFNIHFDRYAHDTQLHLSMQPDNNNFLFFHYLFNVCEQDGQTVII